MTKPLVVTAAELQTYTFPPLRFIVPEILPAGCVLFAGAPKLGKSIAALHLGVSIAAGGRAFGRLPVDGAEVLYAVLEDGGLRRTQDRLRRMLGDESWPSLLHLTDEMPRLDEGGLEWLESMIGAVPGLGLIVIDTLKRIRPYAAGSGKGRRMYDEDYDALARLTDLANRRNVTIIVIHHTREMASDDWIDSVSGSRGLTAAVDTVLAATRGRATNQAILKVVGRDVPEMEWAFLIDFELLTWTLQGDASEYAVDEERREVLELLDDHPILTAQTLVEDLAMSSAAARQRLSRMAKDGQLLKVERGRYARAQQRNPVTDVTTSLVDSHRSDGVTDVTAPSEEPERRVGDPVNKAPTLHSGKASTVDRALRASLLIVSDQADTDGGVL